MKTLAALACLALLLPPAARAAGEVAVMKDSVASHFDAEDTRLMMARVDEALKSSTSGQPLAWRNARTGASGEVTPLDRLQADGLECRRVKVLNRFKSQSGETVWRFCEKPAGQWKLAGPEPAAR